MPLPRLRKPAPPDFVGVGAERAGAEWWSELLAAHPGIESAGALHFFRAYANDEMGDDDAAGYARAFARRRGDDRLHGEWTPRYMADGWTPPLLARVAPEAKLLVMLRDPLAVVRTALAEHVAEHGRRRGALMTEPVDRVNYAAQLARLERFFAADRLLVLQVERCIADPEGEYRRTLRFLGADEDVARPAVPPPDWPAEDLWEDAEGALHARLDPQVQALHARRPEIDLSLWPNFARVAVT